MNDDELEAVRFRAYQIWDHEGRPDGRDEEHFLRAARELGLDQPDVETRAAIAAQAREWDAQENEQ